MVRRITPRTHYECKSDDVIVVVCPAITSYELWEALGGASNTNVTYKIMPNSGHSAGEIEIEEELIKAADAYRVLGK